MRRVIPLILLGFLLCTLGGCSRIELTSSTPAPPEPLLAGNAAIELRFDHPLRPDDAASAPVSLVQDGERIPLRLSLLGSGDGLRVEPLVPLRPGVDAELTLSPGIKGTGRRQTRVASTLVFPVQSSASLAPAMRSKRFTLQGGVGAATP